MKIAPDTQRSAVVSDALGTNQSGMRAQNEQLVLTLIRRHGALSKSEIARLTQLSAQTVSVIMRSLEDEGFLLRGEPQRGRVGQPSVPMTLNPRGAFFFGLKIGRRSVEVVLADFLGQILDRRMQIHAYPDYDAVLRFALETVAALAAGLPKAEQDRIAGLGIAMPFKLWDWAPVIGVAPQTMAAWKTRDITQDLAERLALPIFVQNDATAACSAELVFGAGERAPDFVHFYIAFFVGGGVVLDGRLFQGRSGNAGALGSMPVPDRAGHIRQLIELASLAVLEARVIEAGLDPALLWNSPDHWDLPPDLVDGWVDQAAEGIAHAIHAALAVIDLPVVKIDGWMPADLRTKIATRVREKLAGLDLTGLDVPAIQEGTMGPDARAIGAASQPLLARFIMGYTR